MRSPANWRFIEVPALALVIGFFVLDLDPRMLRGFLLIFAIACAILIARSIHGGLLATVLSLAPLVFLGRISYSLYLWHVPVFAALGAEELHATLITVPALALSLTAAIASYYLVELPFLRRKRRSPSGSEKARPDPALSPSRRQTPDTGMSDVAAIPVTGPGRRFTSQG
jgi:peptidoglycan/LPS O-acetylase OafA/YrhL